MEVNETMHAIRVNVHDRDWITRTLAMFQGPDARLMNKHLMNWYD